MTSPRPLFDRILADEPPLSLTLDGVVARGRRVRRRRYATHAVSAAAVAVVAVAAVGLTSADRATGPARPAATPSAEALTPDQQAIARAIVEGSPAGWTFDLSADRWNPFGVDGTVDDGTGPARLFVRLTENLYGFDGPMCVPDYPDYAGETCDVTTVEDAEVRLRERAESGRSYVEGSFVRPGLAVYVLTGNHTIDWPRPDGGTPAEHVTRERSPYTSEQLSRLLAAIARAARDANVAVTDPPPLTAYM